MAQRCPVCGEPEGSGPATCPDCAAAVADDVVNQLRLVKALHDAGIITDGEADEMVQHQRRRVLRPREG